MAYLSHYPGRLAFYCRMPAVWGGETHIVDMRRVTAALPSDFRRRLEERGVRYTRNLLANGDSIGHPSLDATHKTWAATFGTENPDEAVAQARKMGLTPEWLPDGSLTVTYGASGFTRHPATGETVSFQQIILQSITPKTRGAERYALYESHYGTKRPWPYLTTYGDGGLIDRDDVDLLYEIGKSFTVGFPWSAGDVMILDNILVAHGRNAFTGARDLQVAMLA